MSNRAIIVLLVIVAALGGLYWYSQNGDTTDILPTDAPTDGGTDSTNADDTGDGTMTTSTPTTAESFLARWARAIAPAENVNPAYNNPGGLNMEGDAGSVPASGGTGHDVIGVFSTIEAGYNALENTLSKYVARYQDKTLLQATGIYVLGPNDPRVISGDLPQNVINEATTVAKNLGASINDTLGSLAGK